ncbi:neuronal acetylcholine receptor subunit alpha-9-like [Amphiura filiformis]|uniref:neuronal acetylcholine receptor subunit alpha-9-like n=1 Tax=Amphiura filiformis TaxID=82378 RepID=UPI003B20C052
MITMRGKESRVFKIFAVIMCLCTVCFCENQTAAGKRLHNYLFHDYIREIRPVHNASTATPVIMRMVLRNLLTMDTPEQVFSVGAWLKFKWTDEFLTWNPDEFDGIQRLLVPVNGIWSPDITLHHNADEDFEQYKPDSFAALSPDGTVIWFSPAIYTVVCRMWVKWFPFDVQVCDMVFGSWAYHGLEIDLYPEESIDAFTHRYIANGIWDMVDIRFKREVVHYLCCPEPYPEVHFTLVFKRSPAFYIYYMIVPCILLSILSLLVFYLPPDCGEKLTLSITNLLALVVFQQMIAANMPPTSEDSPIIGTYFLCMIVMVCASVMATGVVMHLSSISRPVPRWVKCVFLDFLSRVLCVSPVNLNDSQGTSTPRSTIQNPTAKDVYLSKGDDGTEVVNDNSVTQGPVSRFNSELREVLDTLHFIKTDLTFKNACKLDHLQWRWVAIICDRLLLHIFVIFMVVCTLWLSLAIVLGSEEAYDEVKRDLDTNWYNWRQR